MVENPATSSPGLAFLLATIARFGARRLAGATGRTSGPTASRSSTAGPRPTPPSSPARRGRVPSPSWSGTPPARRPRSCSPTDPKPTEPPTGVVTDGVLPAGRVRRRARGDRARGGGPPARRLPARATRCRPTCRSTCSSTRCDRAWPCPRCSRCRACPTPRCQLPPEEIAANREAWIEAWTDTVLR